MVVYRVNTGILKEIFAMRQRQSEIKRNITECELAIDRLQKEWDGLSIQISDSERQSVIPRPLSIDEIQKLTADDTVYFLKP